MKPFKIENDVHLYLTSEIDDYGFPEENGYFGKYLVIDGEPDYQTTYEQEISFNYDNNDLINCTKKRPIHRYDRFSRFRTTVLNLLGKTKFKSEISKYKIDMLFEQIPNWIQNNCSPCLAWSVYKQYLKKEKLRIFYNRIPKLYMIGIQQRNCKEKTFIPDLKNLFKDYVKFEKEFFNLDTKRKYFPNMRHLAIRLFEKNGINPPIEIPKMKTLSKRNQIDEYIKKIFPDYSVQSSDLDDYKTQLFL